MRRRPIRRNCRRRERASANRSERELMAAYLASLKADTEVKINQAALEKKQ